MPKQVTDLEKNIVAKKRSRNFFWLQLMGQEQGCVSEFYR
jgi:hypothetical protein